MTIRFQIFFAGVDLVTKIRGSKKAKKIFGGPVDRPRPRYPGPPPPGTLLYFLVDCDLVLGVRKDTLSALGDEFIKSQFSILKCLMGHDRSAERYEEHHALSN